MARPRRTDLNVVKQAQKAVAQATSLQELRAAQAVLLPAIMGATLTETAALLRVGRASVARLQADFRQSPKPAAARGKQRNWGGRRNALLTVEEEEEFLTAWLEQASWRNAGRFAIASGSSAEVRQTRQGFCRLSTAVPAWLAEGGARHASSHK